MEFKEMFKEFTNKVSAKSAEAVQKAKDMAEIASINSQIKNEREGVKNAYIAIGKAVFDAECDKEDSVHKEPIDSIKRKFEKIKEFERQIEEIKNRGVVVDKPVDVEIVSKEEAPTPESIEDNFDDYIIKQ